MDNSKIIIYLIFSILCICIIVSEISSFNEKHPDADDFTKSSIKINGRVALISAVVGLVILIYLIFKDLNFY